MGSNSGCDDWRDLCPLVQERHSHLLKSGKFSDVIFIVGEKKVRVHAHKFILIVASPVFEVQFSERWNMEEENNIQIPDTNPESFETFLNFLYTNELTVTEEEVEDVLGLAHKYLIKSLAKSCFEFLGSRIKVSNVIHIHRIATKFAAVEESLHLKAMEFVLKNGSAVMEDIGFLEIDEATLSIILKNDKLCSDEIIVFRAVMRWAERRCKVEKLEPTVENKRNIVKDLIPHIRFTLMGLTDFSNVVMIENEGILSQAESAGVIQHINATPKMRSHLLPLNMKKRGGVCCVDVYELEDENLAIADERHRRHGFGYDKTLQTILKLRSSQTICVKAIELWLHFDSDEVHYLTVTETLNSGMSASLSVFKEADSENTLVGMVLPKSPANIESENGFQIEKDTDYWIKLVIKNVEKGSYTPSSIGRFKSVGIVNAICHQDNINVKITFNTPPMDSHCCYPCHTDPNYRAPELICDCNLQIKSIHFTIL